MPRISKHMPISLPGLWENLKPVSDHSATGEANCFSLSLHIQPIHTSLLNTTAEFSFRWLLLVLVKACSVKHTLNDLAHDSSKIKRLDNVILVPEVPTGGSGSLSKHFPPSPVLPCCGEALTGNAYSQNWGVTFAFQHAFCAVIQVTERRVSLHSNSALQI